MFKCLELTSGGGHVANLDSCLVPRCTGCLLRQVQQCSNFTLCPGLMSGGEIWLSNYLVWEEKGCGCAANCRRSSSDIEI